ncbi:AraC family transcriptional regulator [Paenibacillus agaridevorans]|uniref:AraC family transcriptional regulator n=1 Tax=Paenibacillus agaridevorans TaxID=171404 RepID=A0A2R5F3E2_9BACL|nr:helix-turn-helix domain-containing protein [Paenibacillus agaridevorans]GBG10501.1 AraC family transcriptional regulator [Paenibacillus agaridevorans]
MKKKWFYRMLLSYSPILLFLVLVLILFFYVKWTTETKVRIQNTNDLFASHVVSVLDSSMKSIEEFVLQQMLTDEKITEYLNGTAPIPPYAMFELTERLADIRTMFPLAGDVYIHKLSSSEVISNNGLLKLGDTFADNAFLTAAIESGGAARWSSPRAYQLYQADPPADVLSLVKPLPITSAVPKGYVVVNVQLPSIQRALLTVNTDASGYLLLADADGSAMFREHTPPQSEWGISTVRSSYTGWSLSVGIPESEQKLMSVFLDGWTLPALITILLSILVLTYVTHRNYKPIEEIMIRIDRYALKRSLQLGKGNKHNEFQFISTALDNLMEKSNEYEAKHKDDLIIRRRYWFNELIAGGFPLSNEEWESEAAELGIPQSFASTVVLVTVLDNREQFSGDYNQRDQTLFKFVVQGVLEEICRNHGVEVWSEWKEADQLCAIVYFGEPNNEARMLDIADQLKEWVAANLQFTVSLYIGTTASEVDDIRGSYREAMQAGQYRALHGYNRIYAASDWKLNVQGDLYAHLHTAKGIIKLVRGADPTWIDQLDRLFGDIRRDRLSREQTAEVVNYMFFSLEKEMNDMPEELVAVWVEPLRQYTPSSILAKELIAEIQSGMSELLHRLVESLQSWRDRQPQFMPVEQIVAYLQEHYSSPDISLDHLSDMFGLAPRVVSKLFKASTGERFVDYVMNLRMTEAKRLLTSTDLPVQSIGEQVGYTQVISFIRTFKKSEGTTPGEYRKLHAGESP